MEIERTAMEIERNAMEIERERNRSIKYDNIHAGGIVTEKYRAEVAETVLEKQLSHLEQIFYVFIIFSLVVWIFSCKRRQRSARDFQSS